MCSVERCQCHSCIALCLQVQRALLGGIHQSSGVLGTTARDINSRYRDSLSVLKGWQIRDITPSIHIVKASGVLGKPKTGKLVLSETEMAMHQFMS